MAARRRPGFDTKAGFRQPVKEPFGGIHPQLLKTARASGQLNLSGRHLSEVPDSVWRINIDVPEEAKNVSLDNTEDRWWEQVDLTKLILASNVLTALSEEIINMPALTVLDVHDNKLKSLPKALGLLENLHRLNISFLPDKNLGAQDKGEAGRANVVLQHRGLLPRLKLQSSFNCTQFYQRELTSAVMDMNFISVFCDGATNVAIKEQELMFLSHNEMTSVPECIGDLRNLNTLHLQHNQITELGPYVGNLYLLEDLDVSNNQLAELPVKIGYLSKLFKLNISHNMVSQLPLTIGDIASLRLLDCTRNKLRELPEDVGRLSNLEQLYLRHNQLMALPVLYNCSKLKELHVGNNALHELTPTHLAHLKFVSVLDVRDNKISQLPDEISLLEGLQRLDLTNNDISVLPYVLGTMVNLKSIVLDGNPMKSVRRDIIMRGTNELKKYLASRMEDTESGQPTSNMCSTTGTSGVIGGSGEGIDPHQVGSSKTLDYSEKRVSEVPADVWSVAVKKEVQIVNLSKNTFTQWPDIFAPLCDTLRELNFGFNKLPLVGHDIGRLHQLVFLELRNNMITGLPDELGSLPNLREITLSNNRLRTLPAVLYRCARLEIILASDNQIDTVDPEGIKGLSKIATLDLQNNNISQVPPHLGLVTQLRSLQLEGNPFRVPRPAILARGTLAVLDYLRGRIAQ